MAESNGNSTAASVAAGVATSASQADKPICAICYGDLCALSELIQSIPVCGHVFHELCLQHWIDYCPSGKEPSCPVCKQCYKENPPTRLYFQSTGNNDTTNNNNNDNSNNNNNNNESSNNNNNNNNIEQNSQNSNSAPPFLPQGAVIRMELRISALDARVQDVDYKVNRLYRESAEREMALLVEMENQNKLHNTKITELEKKTTECLKLKEKTSQLSKELSGFKSENKKLTSRCNILSRSETRTERKLDFAREQIKNLKERVEELEREQGKKGLPKKRKIEKVSGKREKIENNLKKQKKEAIVIPVRNIIKTRSMCAKKDLIPAEKCGRKIRVLNVDKKSSKYTKKTKEEKKGTRSRRNKVAKK